MTKKCNKAMRSQNLLANKDSPETITVKFKQQCNLNWNFHKTSHTIVTRFCSRFLTTVNSSIFDVYLIFPVMCTQVTQAFISKLCISGINL